MDDAELVRRARAGDADAFGQLVQRYETRILRLVRGFVPGDDAADVAQDAFLKAFRKLPEFDERARFYTWLYRIACNTCLQFLRKKSRGRETVNFDDLAEVEIEGHESPDPLDEIERRDLARRLEQALGQLPDSQRMVLVLGPIEGRSYEEIAEILGLTVPVVKGRLHRARENIRRICKTGPENQAATAGAGGDPE